MVHLYCGDGKGKTTAAMGLALRMAGRDEPVLVLQFLKGADSGERHALRALPRVMLPDVPEHVPFTWELTQEEREGERRRYDELMDLAELALVLTDFGLLVLDEACGAVNAGLLPLERVLACLDTCARRGTEAVLTGRDPHPALVERADYLTRFTKERHPYDRGVPARPGIEF